MNDGFYYLHTNGDLIFKPAIAVDSSEYFNSPFVKRVWPIDLKNRLCAWKIVFEALWLKCSIPRAKELVDKWGLDYKDSIEMLKRIPEEEITADMMAGMTIFIKEILGMELNEYWKKVLEEE